MRPAWLVATIALTRLGFLLGRLGGPPRPRVVLATSHLATLTGNLALIRDELARQTPAIPTTVLAFRPARTMRGLVAAALGAIRAGYHLAAAALFVVDDHFLPMYAVRPRPGTTYVQVWHASGAFKRFGYSTLDRSFGRSRAETDRFPIYTNYDRCLVSAMRFAPAYAEAFGQPLQRFDASIGIPRTDILVGAARESAEARARAAFPGIGGKRVILYAPTFRGDDGRAARAATNLDLGLLREALGDDHIVLLRQHPFVRAGAGQDRDLDGFVIDASGHPDIHDLMLVSDVLITDYSSAIYEFSLLGRPILFFAPDLADYERERGFYFDYRTGVPGPVFETSEEVAGYLRSGTFDVERVRRFAHESFDVADGHATQRFIDRVVGPALRQPIDAVRSEAQT